MFKKKSSSLFCLDSFSMLVLAERLGSSQPLNTQIDFPAVSNREGEETSKNTDCFGSFNTFLCMRLIGWGLHMHFILTKVKTWSGNCEWNSIRREMPYFFFSIRCSSSVTWERDGEKCCSAHFSVFGFVVWNHWRVIMKPSYFWTPCYEEKATQKHSAFH